MSLSLPSHPNLDWLKNRAKELLAELRAKDPSTRLAAAQREVARRYGFPSWRALKAHVEAVRDADAPPRPVPDAFTDRVVGAVLRGVGTGQVDAVRSALDRVPALVNAVGPHPFWGGRPQALHVAIESNRHEIFDLLIERGADVNGANAEYMQWSPLMLSVNWKRPEMTRALIARGARIGLAEALMLGDDAQLDAILGREGGLGEPLPNDGTWLHFARTTHAIDRLLALGAEVDRRDFWGATAIQAMSRLGRAGTPLVAHLIAHGVAAGPAELARTGDRAALERLRASDPTAVVAPGTFKAAVDFGHHELAPWMLSLGCDVNGRVSGRAEETPLHSAAWNGDLPMVKLLVEAGADVHARDREHDNTPLGWAETAITGTNNPRCAEVVDYLAPRAAEL